MVITTKQEITTCCEIEGTCSIPLKKFTQRGSDHSQWEHRRGFQ